MLLSTPAPNHCRRGFGLDIEHTEAPGIIGTEIRCLGENVLSSPQPNPSAGNSGRGRAARALCWTREQLGFDALLWSSDHGCGVSLLKSLLESRGWMPGPGSGGFSNPLLPSAARHLLGSQKWGWKTFPEPILPLSQLGRCWCLSLPARSR